MSSMTISCIVFGCIFGGTLLGMFLRAVLPERHLSAESKDLVKLGMGLVGTMTALALALFMSPFRRRPMVLVMALADAGMAAVCLIYLAAR